MARAKICGLTTAETVAAAVEGGAAYVGFMLFARSPRDIDAEAAAELAVPARAAGVQVVAVTVDPDDALLDRLSATLRPDLIQLHGGETPARVAEIAARTGARTIKALAVSAPADLNAARAYEGVADHLMLDARPPVGVDRPGGTGARIDWPMLAGFAPRSPWFLAGGLDAANVGEAVRVSGAPLVDVSSGVERGPGLKDPGLISAFLDAVRRA